MMTRDEFLKKWGDKGDFQRSRLAFDLDTVIAQFMSDIACTHVWVHAPLIGKDICVKCHELK